jgi:hypothetical protein
LGGSESWAKPLTAKQPPGNTFENTATRSAFIQPRMNTDFHGFIERDFSTRVSGACPELAEWVFIRG